MYQQARVVSSRGGKSRGTTSNTSLVEVRLRWYATRSCSDLDRAEVRGTARPTATDCSVGDDRDVGLLAGLGVLVGVVGRLEHGHVVLDVEVAHPVLAALVQVDRAGVRDVEDARDESTVPTSAPVGVDELALDRRAAAQPDARGRRFAPGPVHRAAARLEQVVEHEVAHRVVEPSPN